MIAGEHLSESVRTMAARATTTYAAAATEALPEHVLHVSGATRLVLVVSLSSFVSAADADAFRHLRGSEAFATALRGLRPAPPFLLDKETERVEQDAYTLRIFRSRLLYNHFFPTYRVAWDATMRERMQRVGGGDIEQWQRWAARIRLTRNGLAVITLEQAFEDIPLIVCAGQTLELPPQGERPAAHDQWTIGLSIVEALLDALGRQISLQIDGLERTLHFTEPVTVKHTLRLDRYVIAVWHRVTRAGQPIAPVELKRAYGPTLAAFMEGMLIEADGTRRFPAHDEQQAAALIAGDVATWQEELCLFGGESALIYTPLVGSVAYVGGPLGLDARAYAAYWAGIVRGIEHLVGFRAEAQQVERRTTNLLSRVPGLTRKVTDGHLANQDLALLDHLASGLSDIFDSLPELRSMAVSATVFRADFVRRKFDTLLRELAVQDTLDLVNTNVEQLNFFLSYYNDMRLQWQGQRTNSLGLWLGATVLFMAVSSFLADTFNVVDRLTDPNQNGWTIIAWVLTFFAGLLVLAIMIWRSRKLFNRMLNRRARKTAGYAAHLAAVSGQAEDHG
jgi:hypothetical protein